MDPIISPWFIYLLNVVEKLEAVLFIGIFFTVFVTLIRLITLDLHYEPGFESEQETAAETSKAAHRILVKGTIVAAIFIFLAVIIPDRETIIAMMVAKQITQDRVEKVLDYIDDTKDQIIDAIKGGDN